MFQGCFEEVLRVLQGRLIEGDSRELKGYLKEVQRVFQGTFKAVSKTF